ncbi:MAG: YdiU family protein [Arenicellales bacterium]|nr:YdiU family protein [Arenicellales bacterium]
MASFNETKLLTVAEALQFDNRFTRELPADPNLENHRRQVTGACYSKVQPKQFEAPRLVAYSPEVATLLDLSGRFCASKEFVQTFVGNRLLPGMDPYATCYGGHQFGNWAGQLGDGRAINLGEVINQSGERWALQLKGAGATPYARMADGLAVLRSSIREFLCSEAMHHLGIPTTRALSVVTTGEPVERDMFYDGNPKDEPGAVVCRVAPSFTRFGHFQIFTSRGEIDVLRQLANYTICTDYPHLGVHSATEITEDTYTTWFDEVCRRTARMVVHWQRVGFVHGVMNTDNMSILGLTIDYGPYGWLEDYDPNWTPNTTDAHGRRYRFAHQPQIALWNLVQFARAIYPLVGKAEPLESSLDSYQKCFEQSWQSMMAQKLGFVEYEPTTDDALCKELDAVLQMVETDMTIFYRKLATMEFNDRQTVLDKKWSAHLVEAYYSPEQLTDDYETRLNKWLDDYGKRLQKDDLPTERRRERMNAVNPKYVLRNYLAQLAIDKAEQGDHTMVSELLDLLRRPYDEQPEKEEFAQKRPDWARHRAGCSMLSCSS